MGNEAVLWNVDSRGVATLTLNRPEVNNAYDEALIQGLHDAMDALGAHAEVRALLVRGAGRHFQAGADLKWIARVASESAEENERASRATALAVHRLNTLPAHGGARAGRLLRRRHRHRRRVRHRHRGRRRDVLDRGDALGPDGGHHPAAACGRDRGPARAPLSASSTRWFLLPNCTARESGL